MALNLTHALSAAALLAVFLASPTLATATSDTPEPAIGTKMPDGTIFFGHDRQSLASLYAMPDDAPNPLSWSDAMQYCQTLQALTYHDWRLPTKEELAILFANKDQNVFKDTFNSTSLTRPAWYWSATKDAYVDMFWQQNFTSGQTNSFHKNDPVSVRCVRGDNYK